MIAGQRIILMSVSGAGKSTVGQALTYALGARLIDGGDLHPCNNIVRMAISQPLNDEGRQPWLTHIADVIFSFEQRNESGILICSTLEERYRGRLRKRNTKLCFPWLTEDYDCILQRMRQRKGHFIPEVLLRNQFTALETPDVSENDVLAVDITPDVASIVAHSLTLLHSQQPQRIPA